MNEYMNELMNEGVNGTMFQLQEGKIPLTAVLLSCVQCSVCLFVPKSMALSLSLALYI